MLKSVTPPSAAAPPAVVFRKSRRDSAFEISPDILSVIFLFPCLLTAWFAPTGVQAWKTLRRLTRRDETTVETTTSTIAKMPAAAAMGSKA